MRERRAALRRHCSGDVGERAYTQEPEQLGERRVTISKEGTTAYLKLGVSRAGRSTMPISFRCWCSTRC